MRAFVFLLLLFASSALAEQTMVADNGTTRITLTMQACSDAAVLSLLKDEVHASYRQGSMVYSGRPIGLCWKTSEDRIFIVDAEGDVGYMPMAEFKAASM